MRKRLLTCKLNTWDVDVIPGRAPSHRELCSPAAGEDSFG